MEALLSPKKQRRPLPSLLYESFFYMVLRFGLAMSWKHAPSVPSQTDSTWRKDPIAIWRDGVSKQTVSCPALIKTAEKLSIFIQILMCLMLQHLVFGEKTKVKYNNFEEELIDNRPFNDRKWGSRECTWRTHEGPYRTFRTRWRR